MGTQTGAAPGGHARFTSPAAIALGVRLGWAFKACFRSRRKRLTWLASAAFFLVVLVLTGAIATLQAPAQFSFPPGTLRFSWPGRYLWWVVTPQLMITLAGSQLLKAALLALAYGMCLTLAMVRGRASCCGSLAVGSVPLVLGSLGISFCCGLVVGLIAVLGLAPVATKLWIFSMGSMAAVFVYLV